MAQRFIIASQLAFKGVSRRASGDALIRTRMRWSPRSGIRRAADTVCDEHNELVMVITGNRDALLTPIQDAVTDALVQVCGEHSSAPPMHGRTLGLPSGVVKAPGG